jgi:hypothetical protein
MGSDRAIVFALEPGQTISSGFLKLFVLTEYLDLNWIQQRRSPRFNPNFSEQRADQIPEEFLLQKGWDTLNIGVSMTRG